MTVTTIIESDDATIVTTPDLAATAWTSWVPSVVWSTPGGTPATFVINSAKYTQIGKTVHFHCNITMSNVGIGNNAWLIFSLPVLTSSSLTFFGVGHEIGVAGKIFSVTAANTAQAYLVNSDGTSIVLVGNGAIFSFGGTYETA